MNLFENVKETILDTKEKLNWTLVLPLRRTSPERAYLKETREKQM